MEATEVKTLLEQALSLEEIYVTANGNHFEVIAVSKNFEGLSRVKKQQAIYSPLTELIKTNAIHALSIKAFTPEEWALDKKLMQPF